MYNKEITFWEAIKLMDEGEVVETDIGSLYRYNQESNYYQINFKGIWRPSSLLLNKVVKLKWYKRREPTFGEQYPCPVCGSSKEPLYLNSGSLAPWSIRCGSGGPCIFKIENCTSKEQSELLWKRASKGES